MLVDAVRWGFAEPPLRKSLKKQALFWIGEQLGREQRKFAGDAALPAPAHGLDRGRKHVGALLGQPAGERGRHGK